MQPGRSARDMASTIGRGGDDTGGAQRQLRGSTSPMPLSESRIHTSVACEVAFMTHGISDEEIPETVNNEALRLDRVRGEDHGRTYVADECDNGAIRVNFSNEAVALEVQGERGWRGIVHCMMCRGI